MLSAAVQKATGQTVLDYLKPRLFDPLGIEHPTWETSPQGISTGGYGLSIRTEDIAKFGQLYLQKGKWQGKQLVPEAWVEAATARQTSNGSNPKSDWDQGYGYQFWRCRHGAYRGDGAFGQYCVVLPEQDAVIAITSGVHGHAGGPEPRLGQAAAGPDAGARCRPTTRPTPKLQDDSEGTDPSAARGLGDAGKAAGKTFTFPANDRKLESLVVEESDGCTTLVVRVNGKEQRVDCGARRVEEGPRGLGHPAGAAGGRRRGLDRGRHVHGQAVLHRDAVRRTRSS